MKKLTLHTSFKDLKASNVINSSPTNIPTENKEYKDFLLMLSKNSNKEQLATNKKSITNDK